jgi:tetratricopeptide (TPR) repeat protein
MLLGWAMFHIWYWHPKYVREGRRWLEELLSAAENKTGVPGELIGNVLFEAAALTGMQHDFPSSDAYLERCLALRQSLGDKHGQAMALNGLGSNACAQGDITRARTLIESSLAIDRELSQIPHVQLINLAEVAQIQGDCSTAIECLKEALQIGRETHNQGSVAIVLAGLARVEQLTGDRRQALSNYKESLRLFHELEDLEGTAYLFDSLGTFFSIIEPGEGDFHLAVQLFGAAEELRKSIEVPQSKREAAFVNRNVDYARNQLGTDAFQSAWLEGANCSSEELVQRILQRTDE